MTTGWLYRQLKEAREEFNSWSPWKQKAMKQALEQAKRENNENRELYRRQ